MEYEKIFSFLFFLCEEIVSHVSTINFFSDFCFTDSENIFKIVFFQL